MIESLAKIVSHFPGATNRARCTAHIVNLVSKMILHQFDVRKKTTKKPTKKSPEKANETDDIPTNTTKGPEPDEDDRIADDLDREEQEVGDDEEDDDVELNKDVLTDLEEIEEAMKEEVSEVAKLVKPVRQVLFKVRLSLPLNFITFVTLLLHLLMYFYVQLWKLAYAMKRSTTILLPRWEILEEIAAAEIANPSNKKTLAGSDNASGCLDTLEFDLRNVEVCVFVPWGDRQDNGRACIEAEGLWVVGERVGDC